MRRRVSVLLLRSAAQPPGGADLVATALNDRTVDVFLAFCSGRSRLEGQVEGLSMTALPDELHVGPEYGIALIAGARPQAAALMLYILSPTGQATLVRHGFTPVALPSP